VDDLDAALLRSLAGLSFLDLRRVEKWVRKEVLKTRNREIRTARLPRKWKEMMRCRGKKDNGSKTELVVVMTGSF
jgi:hypothetical protein